MEQDLAGISRNFGNEAANSNIALGSPPEPPEVSQTVAVLVRKAIIDPAVFVLVSPDFRFMQVPPIGSFQRQPMPGRGGVAYDRTVVLDGKFIQILLDVAGHWATVHPADADPNEITAIVAHHNATSGWSNYRNPASSLSPSQQTTAAQLGNELVGAILYHELGHVWHRHALEFALATQWPGGEWHTLDNEDQADVFMGALGGLVGDGLASAHVMLDLLAFYAFHQVDPSAPFQAVQSADFQSIKRGPHSSLFQRKQLASRGASLVCE